MTHEGHRASLSQGRKDLARVYGHARDGITAGWPQDLALRNQVARRIKNADKVTFNTRSQSYIATCMGGRGGGHGTA